MPEGDGDALPSPALAKWPLLAPQQRKSVGAVDWSSAGSCTHRNKRIRESKTDNVYTLTVLIGAIGLIGMRKLIVSIKVVLVRSR